MYIVKVYFEDMQDGNHAYNPGDIYPREGYTPSKARLVELMTSANRRRMPLIALSDLDIGVNKPEAEETQTEGISESTDGIEKTKRKRKKEN